MTLRLMPLGCGRVVGDFLVPFLCDVQPGCGTSKLIDSIVHGRMGSAPGRCGNRMPPICTTPVLCDESGDGFR